MDTKFYKFNDLVTGNSPADRQFRAMYKAAVTLDAPTIVELGTRKGMSTTVFLTACEERGGRLVSIDIADCSGVSDSQIVTFVQCDSGDTKTAIERAPFLSNGVDLIFVDAQHTAAAVEKDLMAWFPYLKVGGSAMFHDVDPLIYRPGARKDSWQIERELSQIFSYLYRLFAANEDKLEFNVAYGLTGLATLRRTAEGSLNPAHSPYRRSLITRMRSGLLGMKERLKAL